MEKFFVESCDVYPKLTAYFYSNLSVLDPTHIQFTVCEKVFDSCHIVKFLMKDKIPRGSIT